MDLGFTFTKDNLLGDVAEGLREQQGSGFRKTVQYQIEDGAGHPLNTSLHWFKAENLLGFYEWLTLVAIFGPSFANRSLARLGYKLTPLHGAEVDASALKADIDSAVEKLTDVSHEIGRAIEHGGGEAKEGEAA